MTEDFKRILGKYITGNLLEQTGADIPQFSDYNSNATNNTREQIANEQGTTIDKIKIDGSLYSEDYDTIILYGQNRDVSKSFIAIFDKQMKLMQVITTFSSGSDLFTIYSLQVAEDNKLYGISQDRVGTDYTVRVLLLNNVFASGERTGNYSVTLRNDYIVPVSGFTLNQLNTTPDVIKKVPGEATYFITGLISNTGGYTQVLKFTINVGASDTWETMQLGNSRLYYCRFSVLINKTQNGVTYNVYSIDNASNNYVEYKIDENNIVSNEKVISLSGTIYYAGSQALAVNSTKIYVAIGNYTTSRTELYYVNGTNLTSIKSINWHEFAASQYHLGYYYLQNIENNVFFTEYEPRQSDGIYTVKVGIIINNDLIYQQENLMNSANYLILFSYYADTYIFKQFNLFNIYINSNYNNEVENNYMNILYLIYNANNYNGSDVENINSLVPKTSVLYNNNIPILAKNLYNRVIRGNTTTSTVQIPNTLLNNDTINQEKLMSETNTELINSNRQIDKNIYETLDINFINTLTMINENDENNNIINTLGASRINDSISQTTDYTSANALKTRITYDDDTTIVKNLEAPELANDGYLNSYLYKITVFVPSDKLISQIDIISSDEGTIYCTIYEEQLSDLENNKIYTIHQKVRIDSDIGEYNLFYNNEQIYYNNDIVLYQG